MFAVIFYEKKPRKPELEEVEIVIESMESSKSIYQHDVLQENRSVDVLAVIYYSLNGKRSTYSRSLRTRMIYLLYALYENRQWSLKKIRSRVGISSSGLSKAFSNLGLSARSPANRTSDAGPPYRKFHVNHCALDDLNHPEAAYVLGFLWADGRLLWPKNHSPEGIRVVINPRDLELLHYLKEFFNSNAEIKSILSQPINGKRYPGNALTIYSRHLADRLADLGFGDRKQGAVSVAPPLVPRGVEADFWRGMWDGDGHIIRDKRITFPLSGWEMGLSGCAATIDALEYFVNRTLGLLVKRVRNGYSNVNYRGYVSGVRAPLLADLLYPPDRQALQRKYRPAQAIVEARSEGLRHGMREEWQGRRLVYVNKTKAERFVAQKLRDWGVAAFN